ncbi:hypothetical protein ACQJBY_051746 [Aegilops geniculata]
MAGRCCIGVLRRRGFYGPTARGEPAAGVEVRGRAGHAWREWVKRGGDAGEFVGARKEATDSSANRFPRCEHACDPTVVVVLCGSDLTARGRPAECLGRCAGADHCPSTMYCHQSLSKRLNSRESVIKEINTKWSPNATKLYGDFLWTRRQLMGQGCTCGCFEESTTHQGAPGGLGAPWWVVPTSGAPRTASLLYKYPNIPETLGGSTKIKSSRRRVQNHPIQSRHHHGWGSPPPLVPLQ